MSAASNSRLVESVPASSPVPGRRINPLRSVRAHAAIAVGVFALVAIPGGFFAWKKGAPKYYAEAVVLISPRFLKNLDDDKEFDLQSNTQYREFVQQNVRTVNRYDIVEEAITRLDASRRPYRGHGESLPAAVSRLQQDLKVQPVPDTYQVAIGLEGAHPGTLDDVVNTVVAVFLERSKDEEFYGRDQRITSLRQEATKLTADIATLSGEKDGLAQTLEVSTFSESFSNPFDRLVVGSKEALAAARERRIIAEALLGALNGSAGNTSALAAYAADLTQKDQDITTLQANLNLRRTELLTKLNGMLPTHPGRAEIESELRGIDDLLQKKRDSLVQGYSSMLVSQRRAELAAARQAENQLQHEVDTQATQAAWYSGNYQKGLNIAYEMERARKRLESIEDRIGFITLESQAPGFARAFSQARRPTQPVSGGRKKLLLMALMASAALALIVPVALDVLDPRILSPNETEKLLGFPPIGFTYAPSRVDAAKACGQLQRLAAAIERDAERNGSRSFLFVPVDSRTNLGALSTQVADELESLGHTIRVFSAPQPSASFSADANATHSCGAMSSRQVTTNGLHEFASMRAELASVERGFTLVTVGPLAEDAGAELLSSSCDVVVLALQAGTTTKAALRAAARTLERIQPRAVSVVMTGYDPDPPIAAAGFRWPTLSGFLPVAARASLKNGSPA